MSSGSFDYLFARIASSENDLFNHAIEIRDVAKYLEHNGYTAAADTLQEYAARITPHPDNNMQRLLKAAEWLASGDIVGYEFEQEYKELTQHPTAKVYIVEYHNGGVRDDVVHYVYSTTTDERTAITDATIELVNIRTALEYDGYKNTCYFTVTGWNGKNKVSELRID